MHRDVAPRVVNMCEVLLLLCRLMTAGGQQVSVFIVTLYNDIHSKGLWQRDLCVEL